MENGGHAAEARPTYEWRESQDPAFFPGRQGTAPLLRSFRTHTKNPN